MENLEMTRIEKNRERNKILYYQKIHENPEFYEQEKKRVKDYLVKRYNEDPEFKEKMKQKGREAYQRRKNRINTISVC